MLFLGIRNDVNKLMMMFDAFIFPSKFEGIPVSLIEAQATGLKTYVSKVVSDEVKITDLVEFISLDKGANYWAKKSWIMKVLIIEKYIIKK